MNCKRWFVVMLLSSLGSAAAFDRHAPGTAAAILFAQKAPAGADFMSAEQLKAKLARNEPVTIIDVRDTDSYLNNNKIKRSIHVKLRRLAYRLTMPPLRNAPRDREIVAYCA